LPAFLGAGSWPVGNASGAPETRNQFKARWHPDEKNIPAQQTEAGSHAWIQSADGNEGRPARPETPSRQRPGEADAVKRRIHQSGLRLAPQNPANRGNFASGDPTG